MIEPIYGDSSSWSPLPALRYRIVLTCDFCGDTEAEARMLIQAAGATGVQAHICDECVQVCARIVRGDR
jgi:hypothetical protein